MKEIILKKQIDTEKLIEKFPGKIHVIIGPRQVGKTTAIKKIAKTYKKAKYETADGVILKSAVWLDILWQEAIDLECDLLIIDEIQKVENWSEAIKRIWEIKQENHPRLVVLGSSSLEIHKGLTESLTGRFIQHDYSHWNFEETKKLIDISMKDFLKYGGYPGSYELLENEKIWGDYLKNSILDTVIGKDILSLVQVKSPALFRQCFDLVCGYASQEISYTKLLGQLQDRGNTDLVKSYIALFEAAFLIKELRKYSSKIIKQRTSSPKIIPRCPALYFSSKNLKYSEEDYGHAFEIVVCNELLKLKGEVFYWREGNFEVDFIYESGDELHAIEVKYRTVRHTKGLEKFKEKYPHAKLHIVTAENYKEILEKLV